MSRRSIVLDPTRPLVAGSFGNAAGLLGTPPEAVRKACDLVEIRLDLLEAEGVAAGSRPWNELPDLPLLFTARRGDEGGAGDFDAAARSEMLEEALDDAALVDVELASAREMSALLDKLAARGIPWVASWHDFEGRPDSFARIPELAARAHAAGAACFKAAIRLREIPDLSRLAEALTAPSPLPLALMGMGPLAPVSRLLAAQCGSVLNYGYLGNETTAPGQWEAALLKAAIASLAPIGPTRPIA